MGCLELEQILKEETDITEEELLQHVDNNFYINLFRKEGKPQTNWLIQYLIKELDLLPKTKEEFLIYLMSIKITNPNDVYRRLPFNRIMDVNTEEANNIRMALVENQIFSLALGDYSLPEQDRILKDVFKKTSSKTCLNFFFDPKNYVGKEHILENNIKVLVKSKYFKRLLNDVTAKTKVIDGENKFNEQYGIKSYNSLTRHNTSYILVSLLNNPKKTQFKVRSPNNAKYRFAELDIFEKDLGNMSPRERNSIIEETFVVLSIPNLAPFYFSKKYLGHAPEMLKRNRKYLARSKHFREFLRNRPNYLDIIDYDDLVAYKIDNTLVGLIGGTRHGLKDMKQRFADYIVFERYLEKMDADTQDDIVYNAIEKSRNLQNNRDFHSMYFSTRYFPNNILVKNRRFFEKHRFFEYFLDMAGNDRIPKANIMAVLEKNLGKPRAEYYLKKLAV